MPLRDLACPECGHIERDVLFTAGTARRVDCLHMDDGGHEYAVAMVPQPGVPAIIWNTTGRGGTSF